MAQLLQCDACKAISPDENGLYIANHWTEISTQHRHYKFESKKYLICDKCMAKGVTFGNEGIRR